MPQQRSGRRAQSIMIHNTLAVNAMHTRTSPTHIFIITKLNQLIINSRLLNVAAAAGATSTEWPLLLYVHHAHTNTRQQYFLLRARDTMINIGSLRYICTFFNYLSHCPGCRRWFCVHFTVAITNDELPLQQCRRLKKL